jgi:predicted nucleotide-binding protein
MEPKVIIEERVLQGPDGRGLQRFATVYIGQEEYRIFAPPGATGDPLGWLAQLHVLQFYRGAEFEIQGPKRARLIEVVQQAIEHQPAERKETMSNTSAIDKRKVFVVHGRNSKARDAVFTFLRAIDLAPLEWEQVIATTGEPSPFIGAALEQGFSIAQAAVVILTGDDMARMGKAYLLAHDEVYEKFLTPQARPNVLFEGGMAFGKYPNRTLLVSIGSYRKFSDIAGRHVLHLSNAAESRQAFAERLKLAGCAVQTENKTDWLNAKSGDFDAAVEDADLAFGKNKSRLRTFKREFKLAPNADFKRKIWIEFRNETDECLTLRNPRWKSIPSGIHATIRPGTFQLQLGNKWCPEEIGTNQLILPPGELCRLWAAPDDAVQDTTVKQLCQSESQFGAITVFANGEEITVPV